MKEPYLLLPTDHWFDYTYLHEVLRSYRAPRDKITHMLRRGEIVRIRKGLYIRSWEYGGRVERAEAANVVYGPSYLSLEYMLSRYGIIPEHVEAITSVTARRSKVFQTALGTYMYEHIPERAYPVGIEIEKRGSVRIIIASREKAICDKVALTSGIRTLKQIDIFLSGDLRADFDELEKCSLPLLEEIEKAYDMRQLTLLVRWFRSQFGKEGSVL